MNYASFFRRVCEHTKGLGLVVRSESFVMPHCPKESAVFISSDAHEVPVVYLKTDDGVILHDADIAARVDSALDMLAGLVSGVARLNPQQRSAYNHLARAAAKAKPKQRITLNA